MNKEPEPLTREEMLRIENIQLRRELLNQQDNALLRDIAQTHMLNINDYTKTWAIIDGRIHVEEPQPDAKPTRAERRRKERQAKRRPPLSVAKAVADEIKAEIAE